MKRLVLLILMAGYVSSYAQQAKEQKTYRYSPEEYGELKAAGQLPTDGVVVVVLGPVNNNAESLIPEPADNSRGGGGGCGCYVEPDSTYTLAMPPNDDGSTGVIAIPFNFCFYGTTYTTLYINNNGNVSFGTPYGTFSPVGFPSNQYVMVAPFWGDVDTRNGLGTVKYKIFPNAIYINWDDVGYYNIHGDKRNTFQLILSDGTDPIAGPGNNVAFCYQEMEWTTGDASNGVNGFGGFPANVGANKGDGINYIQMGRFDQAGTSYDGPFGNNDGISWLDYQSLRFDVCVSNNNVAPVFSDFQPGGINSGGMSGCGDTVKICDIGDTLMFSALAIDPNAGDIVTLSASAPGVNGFTTLVSIPGNPGAIYMQIITSNFNVGMNYITITATDNGSPPASSNLSFWVFVDTTGISNFNPSITGDTLICPGETTVLSTQNTYDSYYWAPTGSGANTSGNITEGGEYAVTVSQNNCYKTVFQDVTEFLLPEPNVYGPTSFCMGSSTNLSTDNFYVTYNWTNNGSFVSNTNAATIVPTTFTLTVTDTNGCIGDTTMPVTIGISVTISGNPNGCTGTPIVLSAQSPNGPGTYVWSNGTNNDTTIALTSGYISVLYTDTTGCFISDSVLVTINQTPVPTITGDLELCSGETTTLNAGTGYTTYNWSNGNTSQFTSPISFAGTYIVTVTQNGCSGDDTVTVVVHALPVPVITGNLNICNGNTTTLSTGTFQQYNWTLNGTSVSTSPTANVGPGAVVVTVTDMFGCQGTDNVIITSDAPSVSISGIPAICAGNIITLTASSPDAPGTYSWSNGDTDSVTTVTSSGNYTVTFTDIGGCSNTDVFNVTFWPAPNANFIASPDTAFTTSTVVQFTDQSTVASPGVITGWVWEFSDSTMYITQNTSHVFDYYGQYTVTLYIVTADGCTDSITQSYWVIPPLTFPNVFSPGGSPGSNDFLVFPNLKYFTPAKLQVFNRWGVIMYESANYKNDWDGKHDGKLIADGTYFYILSLPTGETHHSSLTVFGR